MKKEEWNLVSKDYYDEILSPIKDSEKNPLFNDLDKLENKTEKSAIDLGCGIGEIEETLSNKFKEVLAVDFSEGMLARTKERNKHLKNVKFELKDISKLEGLENKFDVAIAINSIITSEVSEINKMLTQVNNTLKEGGKFMGIFPSMEVYLYQSLIIAENMSKEDKNSKKVRKRIRKLIKEKEHDFLLGITNFEGKQKNYYQFELVWRLKKAGFKKIEIKKVLYSWEEFAKAGQEYFPEEESPWDWYVICEK
ncbi:Ubiquinone/menaquinone biosynthesis C-methyltransferase UbiE [uncultured archaeon]|nr:Ubiquinone/menaquinone biosynthesis C-methyltransferase UbiE [uncultured archaeon]